LLSLIISHISPLFSRHYWPYADAIFAFDTLIFERHYFIDILIFSLLRHYY